MATDASTSGWVGSVLSPTPQDVSDYWAGEEVAWDITTREATAFDRMLLAFQDQLRNARVDDLVDNQAFIHAWNNQGGWSAMLNNALKKLFYTTADMNVLLHLSYVPTKENSADLPSRRLSSSDSRLTDEMWRIVQRQFGGPEGHTCNLMALDSNAMKNEYGHSRTHFTP